MSKLLTKREFLSASIGAGLGMGAGLGLGRRPDSIVPEAVAQATTARRPRGVGRNVPGRQARITPLFKSPPGFPNGLEVDPDGRGIWVGEQKMSGQNAITYNVPEPADLSEAAWLIDWEGKLLKTVMTECRNMSGMGVGGGYVWMVANAPPNGVFQTDMDSRTVSHRQIPLGDGGCHGATYRDGKLWINSTRMRAVVRVDPVSWIPEYLLPLSNWDRTHDITFDDTGALWVVTGTQYSERIEDERAGLAKYDASSGRLLEYVEFDAGASDPHGLTFHDGALYSCDAGIHPGWPTLRSKTSGWVFRIDLV